MRARGARHHTTRPHVVTVSFVCRDRHALATMRRPAPDPPNRLPPLPSAATDRARAIASSRAPLYETVPAAAAIQTAEQAAVTSLVDAAETDNLAAVGRLLVNGDGARVVRTVDGGGGVDVSLMRIRNMHDDSDGDDDGG